MAKLTAASRRRLPKGAFALPEKRAYPIHNRQHGANALARCTQHCSSDEKPRVFNAVCRRYPSLPACVARRKG